ncbi:MAG TPA: DUF4132 domain-containing protein [Planctomycetaceae bacterium]|nr:DUF4132 domain-containing protein [Planctomycetaceae bacterium]
MAKTSARGSVSSDEEIIWLEADDGYSLGVKNGKLVARNAKGKKLSAVPKNLKTSELAEQLSAMCEWLAEHRISCQRAIERWMLRSLPVPIDVLSSVWIDPDWSEMLQNMIVCPLDGRGKTDATQTGLLREIDSKKGVGVVDRDGETQWIKAAQILFPHPILIDGLEDLREIAADMNFSQSVEQIFRPIFAPREEQLKQDYISDFQNGKFEQLNFATSLCRRLGFPVRGGYACSKLWENGKPLEARYWIGADYPEGETYTEDLIFVNSEQKPQKISSVGAVTFSEGVLMATQIYAKRTVEKESEEE